MLIVLKKIVDSGDITSTNLRVDTTSTSFVYMSMSDVEDQLENQSVELRSGFLNAIQKHLHSFLIGHSTETLDDTTEMYGDTCCVELCVYSIDNKKTDIVSEKLHTFQKLLNCTELASRFVSASNAWMCPSLDEAFKLALDTFENTESLKSTSTKHSRKM